VYRYYQCLTQSAVAGGPPCKFQPHVRAQSPHYLTSICSSCVFCRQRKLKCNRETPCHACVRAREACVYERFPHDHAGAHTNPGPYTVGTSASASHIASSSPYPSPASHGEDVTRNTIGHLGGYLRTTGLPERLSDEAQPSILKTSSSLSGDFHAIRDGQHGGRPCGSSRSVWHKTRLFGQSQYAHYRPYSLLHDRDIY